MCIRDRGYIVRYGIAGDKLYNNFQVMGENTLEIGSLNKGVAYYFTIDAYNAVSYTHLAGAEIQFRIITCPSHFQHFLLAFQEKFLLLDLRLESDSMIIDRCV